MAAAGPPGHVSFLFDFLKRGSIGDYTGFSVEGLWFKDLNSLKRII